MIIGMGVDIVRIPRINSAVERFGDRFLQRAFCPEEIEWCMRKRDPGPCLSGRFAAKEALVKALGTGFRQGITLRQICVRHLDNGKPELRLSGAALDTARGLGVTGVHVSISHETEYAVATVVVEGGN
jgi:holo-[acyl-carrier protein] synthase